MPEAETIEAILAELAGRQAEIRRLTEQQHVLARQAKDAGATPTDIARAADVTRPTVYRWLEIAGSGTERVDVAESLDAAMRLIQSKVGAATIAMISGGLGSPKIDVKVRRYRSAVQNLTPSWRPNGEERQILAIASTAASEAEAAFRRTGKWLKTIRLPEV